MRGAAVGLASAALVGAVGGAVASAGAAPPARFAVTLSGELTTTWRLSESGGGDGPCVVDEDEDGAHRITFTTTRPVVVPIVDGAARATLGPLAGRAATSGAAVSTCTADRDARAPACGPTAQSFRGARITVTIARGRVLLGRLEGAPPPPARRCGAALVAALRRIPSMSAAAGRISLAELRDARVSRLTVRGRHTRKIPLDGPVQGSVTERVRWTATLERRPRSTAGRRETPG